MGGHSSPDTLASRLGPLLVYLSDSDSHDELRRRMEALWAKIDYYKAGKIYFAQLCSALRGYNMPFTLGEWSQVSCPPTPNLVPGVVPHKT
jgi:hypothetical protein